MSNLVGFLAGTLTTLAFVPQVVKVVRGGSVRDLSLLMLVTFNSGVALWMTYGILVRAAPIIITNGATLALAGYLLVRKIADGSRRTHETAFAEPAK